jgi:hypothetical protein
MIETTYQQTLLALILSYLEYGVVQVHDGQIEFCGVGSNSSRLPVRLPPDVTDSQCKQIEDRMYWLRMDIDSKIEYETSLRNNARVKRGALAKLTLEEQIALGLVVPN